MKVEARISSYSLSACSGSSADGLVRGISICIAAVQTKDVPSGNKGLDGLVRHGLGLSESLRCESGDGQDGSPLHLGWLRSDSYRWICLGEEAEGF